MANNVPPDPDGQNDDRAGWVETALLAFTEETGCELEGEAAPDFMADLAHWCDRNGLEFKTVLQQAIDHYHEETDGKGLQMRGIKVIPAAQEVFHGQGKVYLRQESQRLFVTDMAGGHDWCICNPERNDLQPGDEIRYDAVPADQFAVVTHILRRVES